ncbi:hypothetical protein [Liquorilactobacillus satsumensis]|uniref:hypothetical protein n=1 Tax=Liquorilactobacillus satsumensis TaxID=259059 RepID=UPI00345CC2AE
MEQIIIKPQKCNKTSIKRNYAVLKMSFSDFSVNDQNKIKLEANQLAAMANSGAANSGHTRNSMVKKNDAFAGIISEYATMYLLNSLVPNSAIRPPVTNTENQVDVLWHYLNQDLSIEVRSSFVNNGIPFALFAVDSYTGKTYFDVLGSYYQQSYKSHYEPPKDAYSRVLFEGRKYNVYNRFVIQKECFYVIGFMDGPTLINTNYHKPLTPNSAFTKHGSLTGSYYVAPMDTITDIYSLANNVKLKLNNPF